MTIPTEASFIQALRAYSRPLDLEALREISRQFSGERPKKKQAIDKIQEALVIRAERLADARKTDASRWLLNDRMVQAGLKSISKSGSLSSLDLDAEELYEALLSRHELIREQYAGPQMRDRSPITDHIGIEAYQLMSQKGMASVEWEVVLLDGYRDYFFGNDLKSIMQDRKRLAALYETAIAGIQAIEEIAKAAKKPSTGTKRLVESVSRHVRICESRSPFKRFDATVKERHLAYRLWRGHKSIFSTHKPRAIYRLLMAEGIKNQIDERTLARLFKSFTEFQSKLQQRPEDYTPSNLIFKYRHLSTMSAVSAEAKIN